MLKKLLVAAAAAAAMAVPLAGVACADQTSDHQGGIPGKLGGTPPGEINNVAIKDDAKLLGYKNANEAFRDPLLHSPYKSFGDAISDVAHTP